MVVSINSTKIVAEQFIPDFRSCAGNSVAGASAAAIFIFEVIQNRIYFHCDQKPLFFNDERLRQVRAKLQNLRKDLASVKVGACGANWQKR